MGLPNFSNEVPIFFLNPKKRQNWEWMVHPKNGDVLPQTAWDTSSKVCIILGMHHPGGSLIPGMYHPRDASPQGCIIPGMHHPRDGSSNYFKGCNVHGCNVRVRAKEHSFLFMKPAFTIWGGGSG
jgi:hypothetical protein